MPNNELPTDLIAAAKRQAIANRKAKIAIKNARAKQGFATASLNGFQHNGNFNAPYKAG